jgi:hypothetical protein
MVGRFGRLWPAGRALPAPRGFLYEWRRDPQWFDVPEPREIPPVKPEVIDALADKFPRQAPTLYTVGEDTGPQLVATIARQQGQWDVIEALIAASVKSR